MSDGPRRRAALSLVVLLTCVTGCAALDVIETDSDGFVDITEQSGVRSVHVNGADGRKWYPETFGGGVCVTDFDGDEDPDLVFVTGRPWDDARLTPGVSLYRNRGDGRFDDVTAGSGIHFSHYGMGCSVADYDQDGREDLFLTGYGGTALYHNEGNGRYTDATAGSGVDDGEWTTCSLWFDANGDGRLDLFVCRYVGWTPQTDKVCRLADGTRVFCGPDPYPPRASRLLLNSGAGAFEDGTELAGLSKPGKALGVAMLDVDLDGHVDLFVANDQIPNYLYRSRGDGRFEDWSDRLARWPGRFGMARAGMGVAVDDERRRIAVGNFFGEGVALYQADAFNRFRDHARETGVLTPSLPFLTFGVVLEDLDLDGVLDLVTANGHVDASLAQVLDNGVGSAERPLLFLGREDGTFDEIGHTVGLTTSFVGRGLVTADIDGDGDLDLIFTENGGAARVYRNDLASGNWLRVSIGSQELGAMIQVTAGGRTQSRMVRSGSSYLSQSDRTTLFGIGEAVLVDELAVVWPDGRTQRLTDVPVNRTIRIGGEGE